MPTISYQHRGTLPLTRHLAFSSLVLFSLFQHQGLDSLKWNKNIYMCVCIHIYVYIYIYIYMYMWYLGSGHGCTQLGHQSCLPPCSGRAALQLVLHASCWEGSWCHHSLLRRCRDTPRHARVLPALLQVEPTQVHGKLASRNLAEWGDGRCGLWEMQAAGSQWCLTPVHSRSSPFPSELVISPLLLSCHVCECPKHLSVVPEVPCSLLFQ